MKATFKLQSNCKAKNKTNQRSESSALIFAAYFEVRNKNRKTALCKTLSAQSCYGSGLAVKVSQAREACNVDGLAKCGIQHLSSRLRELSYENKFVFFENVSSEAVNPKPLTTIDAKNPTRHVSTRILPNRCCT